MKDWSEAVEIIKAGWPQMRQNLLKTAELDKRLRDAGIPTSEMPGYLKEAIRIAQDAR